MEDLNGQDWMTNLEILKDLKGKHARLQVLQEHILELNKCLKETEKSLEDFRTEVDALEQEKQKHTEIIRLINKDLEDMNSIIKTSEIDRQKISRQLKDAVSECVPVKEDVDQMRRCVNMDPVQFPPEERHIINSVRPERPEVPQAFPGMMVPQNNEPYGFHNHMQMPFNHQSASMMNNSAMNQHGLGIGSTGMGFRQKPAPMKICPNCTSEIHRNAPICPTCKSKSHSKNPKKSKKKMPA